MASGNERTLPEPVTGTEPGLGPRSADEKETPHHEFFDRALDDAIAKIVAKKWPTPADYDVTVTFEATVEVRNPGGVGQYRVTMS